jgi:3-hydroxypropanoate dehydrogenase
MNAPDTMLAEPRRIGDSGLRQLFLDARTHNGWLDKPVPDTVLREIYEIAKFGPTSMNTQPMRLLFLRTAAAKERLRPHLGPANVDKTMAARSRPSLVTISIFMSICPGCFHITRMRKACSKARCR